MEYPALVGKEEERIGKGKKLADHGRQRRSLDAHIQYKDENRVQDGIERHRKERQSHSNLGVSRDADQAVEAEIQVGEHIAQQDNDHIAPRERHGVLRRPEEPKYRAEEAESQS